MRETLQLVRQRLSSPEPPACSRARPSSQSASAGLRGSSGPCRYVPTAASTRHPSSPEAPSFPWPARTRPRAIAPGSSRVRPAWFSKPATVVVTPPPRSTSSRTSPISRLVAGDRLEREHAGAREPRPVASAIAAAEQLVAAADRQGRRPGRNRFTQRLAAAGQVGRDERLLAILAAADVDEVVVRRRQRVARVDPRHLDRVPAEGGPPLEHRDVAAIRVDVEVVRVEVGDADPHPASSQ